MISNSEKNINTKYTRRIKRIITKISEAKLEFEGFLFYYLERRLDLKKEESDNGFSEYGKFLIKAGEQKDRISSLFEKQIGELIDIAKNHQSSES